MKQIQKAIETWINKNKEVTFIGSFTAFDEKGEVNDKESLVLGFGDKELVNISLEELNDGVKKEKKDFINW